MPCKVRGWQSLQQQRKHTDKIAGCRGSPEAHLLPLRWRCRWDRLLGIVTAAPVPFGGATAICDYRRVGGGGYWRIMAECVASSAARSNPAECHMLDFLGGGGGGGGGFQEEAACSVFTGEEACSGQPLPLLALMERCSLNNRRRKRLSPAVKQRPLRRSSKRAAVGADAAVAEI